MNSISSQDLSFATPVEMRFSQVTMRKIVLLALISVLIGIVGNLIAEWILDDLLLNTFSPSLIVTLIAIVTFGVVLTAWLSASESDSTAEEGVSRAARSYWVITAVAVLAVVVIGITVVLVGPTFTRTPSIYFIVDATDKMGPIFGRVREQVQIVASGLHSESRIGLRVYGGIAAGSVVCQDSRQLLELSRYPQPGALLDSVLAGVHPGGNSSMTGATLEALARDFQGENQPVRLILVTSGIDELCDPPAGTFLKDRAQDLGRNVELVIISVGVESGASHEIFESYADAFGGNYLPIPTVEDLSSVVGGVFEYGYGYGVYGVNGE